MLLFFMQVIVFQLSTNLEFQVVFFKMNRNGYWLEDFAVHT